VRPILSLSMALAMLCPLAPPAYADAAVEGTVALPPAVIPIATPRYPISASYTIGAPDPPAAVVYLDGDFPAQPPGRAEVAQRHYQFTPGLLPVRRGTVVAFPNLDDEYHSVFSYSKPKRFDLGRYHMEESPAELVFDQPGVVRLYCEIHDHMRGTILVLDTPYFTKTAADGRYRLDHLPPGRHVLKAWRDEGPVLERVVELPERGTMRVDFTPP
jgi:hypothetical protein